MRIEYYSHDMIMNMGAIVFFIVFIIILIQLIITVIALFKKTKYYKFKPKISIIIHAYNEEKNIGNCLRSVLKSKYDSDIEIICIDDGSTDNTRKIISRYAKKNHKIRLIKNKHLGKSASLNTGVKNAKFDYILTLDADTVIQKEFLKQIIRPFKDKSTGATNGVVLIKNPHKIIEYFQATEYFFHNIIRVSFSRLFNNGIWFFGAAACYRKDVLTKVGGFGSDVLTEDMDISLKIFEKGFNVITVESAYYFTEALSSIPGLINQRMRWFYGGLQCVLKHYRLIKKNSFALRFLLFNQVFWSFYSIIVIPLIIYQVIFWMPHGFEVFAYLFRWFSLLGPIYVLYKIPVWGLSLINIFGVLAGILSSVLLLLSTIKFSKKFEFFMAITIFFYFPYTLILNLSLALSLFKYLFSEKKFIK